MLQSFHSFLFCWYQSPIIFEVPISKLLWHFLKWKCFLQNLIFFLHFIYLLTWKVMKCWVFISLFGGISEICEGTNMSINCKTLVERDNHVFKLMFQTKMSLNCWKKKLLPICLYTAGKKKIVEWTTRHHVLKLLRENLLKELTCS